MAKTIEEIKDAQAKNHGWHSYETICEAFRTGTISNNSFNDFLDDVIKHYANSKLEAAAECAEIRKVIEYPNFPKVFVVDFKTKTDSVLGVKETLYVNKKSILNLREGV